MEIKKSALWFISTVFLLVVAGYLLISGASGSKTNSDLSGAFVKVDGTSSSVPSGDVQIVNMYVEGSSYIFEPSSVKAGIPVKIVADISRMPGCSKSVISSELNIRKTFLSNDSTLEFTPAKAGTFYFSCSMNMYKGYLTVLQSDGSKSSYVQSAPTSGGTCGGSDGGCGCGG